MLFFDASAVVKAYVTEIGSDEVRATLVQLKGSLYLTPHVVLEVLSAFAKKMRTDQLNKGVYRAVRRAFLTELSALNVLPVEAEVFTAAGDLIDRHPRVGAGAMDILHVASALQLQAAWPHESVVVASSDHAFLSPARATGLRTFDPETESFSQLQARLG
jgi:predicted nucleic acid-binding protein